MIATLVYLTIAFLLFGIIIKATYDFNQSQAVYLQSVEYASEILMVKKSLLALSTTYGVTFDETTIRYPALPVGVNQGDSHTLPTVMMKPINPKGLAYVYCPFGAVAAPTYAMTINGGSGSIYDANTSVLVKNGRSMDYVTSTADNQFTDKGILGFIISPVPFTGSTRCQDVTFDEQLQKYVIAGGRVETITAIEVEAVNLNNK